MENRSPRVTLLAGGVGAAKFVRGLSRVCEPEQITIISNTGDDIDLHGLWISPDVDIMLYTLAGIVDSKKGWGIRGDTFETLAALKDLGEETWFRLGDKDMATHILRTSLRARGLGATEITEMIAERLGVQSKILPMSDARVHTEVLTPSGRMHFQEFFVREDCRPDIIDVTFKGADASSATPQVIEAILSADIILICPSNPIASIGPILRVGGVRDSLKNSNAVRIAVSPLVDGKSLKGPSDRMMRAKGFSPDAAGVAACYHGLIDGLVIDQADRRLEKQIEQTGVKICVADTLMTDDSRKISLARCVLDFARNFNDNKHRHSRQNPVLC